MQTSQFQSTNHKRYENGIQLTHDFVPRLIQLQYSDDAVRVIISVIPTLSPKGATFQKYNHINNVATYVGDDPDFRFEVEADSNSVIKRVSVIRTDRNLELKYF